MYQADIFCAEYMTASSFNRKWKTLC